MPIITIRAHAKINLNLRVLGRRPDGYHDLRTVFQSLSLHDILSFVPRPGPFAIETTAVGVPVDRANLVWRAAEVLSRHAARAEPPDGVLVRIEKRIPVKAGLGGGSADAAAALIGLARVWDVHVGSADLAALGSKLGADVPFFFSGGAALGLGRGDSLYLLADLPPIGVLLVVPAFDVSTADAYTWVDEARGRQAPGSGQRASAESGDEHRAGRIPCCPWPPPDCDVVNDFEPVVESRHGEVAAIKRGLLAAGASASAMTGSGSTVFGLFEDKRRMSAAVRTFQSSGYSVLATETLPRDAYVRSVEPQSDPGARYG